MLWSTKKTGNGNNISNRDWVCCCFKGYTILLLSFFDKALLSQKKPVILFINNSSIIEITKIYQGYKKAKYIDI